jgi:Zn-dependent M28 family amino/carboxypeptidase
MKSRSMPLPAARLTVSVQVESKVLTTRNVLGMIPGTDPSLAGEVVMIGAHYDHDGARGGYVWPGADDNGSGTAAVLEIARAFAANNAKPKRTVVFALWSAEEKGLLGSKYYTENPPFPVEKMAAYINLDMIGRDGDPTSGGDPHASLGSTRPASHTTASAPKIDPANWMSVEGSQSYPTLKTTTDAQNAIVGLSLTYRASDMRFGASDHLYFARRGVPVISYFNGGHDDYHQPTDTIDKLNFAKIEKVARLCYLSMWDIANAQGRPARQEPAQARGN